MDDHALLTAFEASAIATELWGHREHLRVVFLLLRDQPFEQAVARMRSGIRALNHRNGVVDTLTSGYHETLTVAWARIVATSIRQHRDCDNSEAFLQARPELLDKTLSNFCGRGSRL